MKFQSSNSSKKAQSLNFKPMQSQEAQNWTQRQERVFVQDPFLSLKQFLLHFNFFWFKVNFFEQTNFYLVRLFSLQLKSFVTKFQLSLNVVRKKFRVVNRVRNEIPKCFLFGFYLTSEPYLISYLSSIIRCKKIVKAEIQTRDFIIRANATYAP